MRLAAAALALLAAAPALGADEPDARAVRAARDAVLSRPEFRYDEPVRGESMLRRLLGWFQDLVTWFQTEYPILFLVTLAAMGLVLVVLVAHLVWTWRVARGARYEAEDPRDLEAALRRLDPSPFRALAEQHARAGRFAEAVRELYSALLLTLDRRGALRYARHKALLDYRIEAARDDAARSALDLFSVAYPPGSFGRRPPDAETYRRLSAAVDALAAPEPVR